MSHREYKLIAPYQPTGDQPSAIRQLTEGLERCQRYQTLLGVTGSGKTFTISNVIANVQRPTLVISPNKTLAAQLYGEFKSFFPDNAIEFFISYYDYYQPEAYIPSTDTYIEKDVAINDEIDRLRLRATSALVEGRRDVIIVASVSCIYGIGSPQEFAAMILPLSLGMSITRKELLQRLNQLLFGRNDSDLGRACYRVRGDIIDVVPAYEDEIALRIELWDNTIERLSLIRILDSKVLEDYESYTLYPARQFITTPSNLHRAIAAIKDELYHRLKDLNAQGKYLEAQRLEQRTLYDIEMLQEVGYCSGIENYSMHLSGRTFGERPATLFDYFPQDYLLIIDESHVTIPQIRAMYNGDRHRKEILVEHGFRLPSALENRPLRFDEFESLIMQVIFISATPGDYELGKCAGVVVEQIIRPTGLLDPRIEVRPVRNQIDDLLEEIRLRTKRNQRVLVTTLTKRMAEDLAEFLGNLGIQVAYIHSDIDALDRVEIIRKLRLGEFDVLVGVNLLREGLDMPEVSLVAILDADKEGFLRSERSLLQIAGRTARNADGTVILYADTVTDSMRRVIEETNRRRTLQEEYNRSHGINPTTVYKTLDEILSATTVADVKIQRQKLKRETETLRRVKNVEPLLKKLSQEEIQKLIDELFTQMKQSARDLDFERAAELRDEIQELQLAMELYQPVRQK